MIYANMLFGRGAFARSLAVASTVGIGLAATPLFAQDSSVPVPTVSGPIANQDFFSPENDYQFFATDIALGARGYVEEEFFIEGTANTYDLPVPREMEREIPTTGAEIVQADIAYKTRVIVRRPADATDFNGTVLVEWLNVSDGFDGEYFWVQAHKQILRDGYAYVGVSAQDNSISVSPISLKTFSPERYGDLDVAGSGDECCAASELSYDIFAQTGQAVASVPELMGGLEPQNVIGIGMSQSGIFLGPYANYLHAEAPVYDGLLIQVWDTYIREDLELPVIKVISETEEDFTGLELTQPDTDWHRTYWVAGSTHGDIVQRTGRNAVRLRDLGIANTGNDACGPVGEYGDVLSRNRVPLSHVVSAAVHHLKAQIEDGIAPPHAPALELAEAGSEDMIARDENGNALGGIRLAAIEVPTARANGVECSSPGVWEPFSDERLAELYPSHDDYIAQVRAVVESNIANGFILAPDGEETIAEAEASVIGTGLICGQHCLDRSHYRLDFSSTGILRHTTVYYDIVDPEDLFDALTQAHRNVAEGDTAEGVQAAQYYALAAHNLRSFIESVANARQDGRVTDTAADVLTMQAYAIINGLGR